MSIDAEKELMLTVLTHIAHGKNVKSFSDAVRLAAKALVEVEKIRSRQILLLAEQKLKEVCSQQSSTPVTDNLPVFVHDQVVYDDIVGNIPEINLDDVLDEKK